MKIPHGMNSDEREIRNMLRFITQGHAIAAMVYQLNEAEMREIWPELFREKDQMVDPKRESS